MRGLAGDDYVYQHLGVAEADAADAVDPGLDAVGGDGLFKGVDYLKSSGGPTARRCSDHDADWGAAGEGFPPGVGSVV